MRRSRPLAAIGFAFAVAVAAVAIFPFGTSNLTPMGQPWMSTGAFTIGGAYSSTQFDKEISTGERKQVDLWGSWSGSDSNVGELRSPVFNAPAIIECFVSGYPRKPGMELFLEREADHLRIPLPVPGDADPEGSWRKFHWWLPSNTRGRPVQLVAIDGATGSGGWLGVSTPRAVPYLALVHRQVASNLVFLLHFLLTFLLFLLPGCGLASLLVARWPFLLSRALMIIIAASCSLGYLSFWAFFFSKAGGKLFSYAVYLASAGLIVYAVRRGGVIRRIIQVAWEPLGLSAVAAICYLCFTFLFINPQSTGATYLGHRFFNEVRPGDNYLPLLLAEKIYHREPLRPFSGDWLSSDRPPLQSGIYLLERPLPVISNANVELNYELVATGLQCLWICGVWRLLTSLGTPSRQIQRALVLLIFSGFLFYNTVYTWPKLLAASLILFAVSVVFEAIKSKSKVSYVDTGIASTCVGLALMAHPGSTFSLAAFGIIALRYRAFFPLRRAALVLPILCIFIFPWSAYQRFVDPPGNRLLKMHLGASISIDSRSTVQTIRDAYANASLRDIVRFKWSNVRLLAGKLPFDTFGWGDWTEYGRHINRAATENSRIAQREWIWNAVGLLNVGWFAALFHFWRRTKAEPQIPFSRLLIIAALGNLLFWALITFGPDETVTTHSSYADILLLNAGLLGFVLELPRFFLLALLGSELFNLFVVWVWSPPYALASQSGSVFAVDFQWPLLFIGGGSALVLLWHLGGSLLTLRDREKLEPRY